MTTFQKLVVLAACVLVPGRSAAQAKPIPTTPREFQDYYAAVTAISAGPVEWVEAPTVQVVGRFHRAVVITSEIYTTLFVEQVTLGEELCCKEVAWARQVTMFRLASAFGLRGELTDLVVGDWRSPGSFEFTLHDRWFLVTIGEGTDLLIAELTN